MEPAIGNVAIPVAEGETSRWQRWFKRARVPFLALCVGVLVVALVREWPDVRARLSDLDPVDLMAAGVAGLLAALPLSESWRALMRDLGSPLARTPAFRIFYLGQLAKYVPGSVWSVVAHAEVAATHGVPRPRTATASLLNLAVVAATGALVGIPAVFIGASGSPLVWMGLIAVPLLLVALHPRVINRGVNVVLRRLGRTPLESPISGRGLVIAGAWALVAWLLYGADIALLVHAFGISDNRLFIVATCGFALAWVCGLLVPFAPSGGGVRELVLVATLAPVAPPSVAIAVALFSRVILTLADLLLAGIATLVARRHPGDRGSDADLNDDAVTPSI